MHSLQAETKPQSNHSFLTAILFWCGLVIVASNYFTIPLLSILSQVFDTSIATVAWTGSAFSLFYAIGSLFSGPISDRYGRKQVILVGLLVLTVITLTLPLFESLLWVIALRSIQGLAASSFAPVAISYIVDHFPGKKIVTTIGFVSSSFLISAIAGQVFSSLISQHFGWQSVFYYAGVIYLFTAILVAFYLPKIKTQHADSQLHTMFKQFKTILTDSYLIRAYMITVSLLLTFVAVYTVLGDYLTTVFQLTEEEILYIRVVGIIGMLFAPIAGKLANRFGVIQVLRGGLFLAGLGVLMLGLTSNLTFLIIMSVIFVTGIALTVPTLISLVGDLGGENHGVAVSFYAFVLFIGTSLGPIIAVTLLKTGSYAISFSALAVLLIISLLISFFIKRKNN